MKVRSSRKRGVAALLEDWERLDSEFIRLPGLFRRWELAEVLEAGVDFHVEEEGASSDGLPLFALYRRERHAKPI